MNLRPHKTKSYDQRKKEEADFSEYIAEQCENAQQPIQVYSRLCQDFVQIAGCSLSVDSLKHRFLKFREGVAANTTLPHNTKVKQLFALGVSLDPGLLRQLQANATVIVDDKNRITKYVSKSKELKLEGNHGNRDSGGILKRSDTASSSRNGEEEQDPRAPAPKKAKTRESSTVIRGNPAPTPNSAHKTPKNPAPWTPKTAPNPPVRIPENPAQQTQRIEVINLDDDEEEADVKPVIHQMNLSLNQDEERIKVENPEEHVKPLRECMPLDAQKVYLKYTQNLMTAMKVPADEKLSKKMQTKIEEIERLQMLGLEQEDKVKFDVFGNIIISGINLAKMNLEPLEDSRSLREFTLLLKMNILHLGLPDGRVGGSRCLKMGDDEIVWLDLNNVDEDEEALDELEEFFALERVGRRPARNPRSKISEYNHMVLLEATERFFTAIPFRESDARITQLIVRIRRRRLEVFQRRSPVPSRLTNRSLLRQFRQVLENVHRVNPNHHHHQPTFPHFLLVWLLDDLLRSIDFGDITELLAEINDFEAPSNLITPQDVYEMMLSFMLLLGILNPMAH